MELLLILTLVGFLASFLSALAGGGAGLLQLPVLLFLNLPFAQALGTHKVATSALGIGAALRYLRSGSISRDITFRALVAGLPGVVLGAVIAAHLPTRIATIGVAVLVLSAAFYSLCHTTFGATESVRELRPSERALSFCVLFVIGALNGSFAAGTGLFVTLWLVRFHGLSYTRAVAHTLVTVGFFWNLAGMLTIASVSPLNWSWALALSAGAVAGGFAGAAAGLRAGNRAVKRAFEAVSILTGLTLLARVLC